MIFQSGETTQELETLYLVITFVGRLSDSQAQGLSITLLMNELASASQMEELGSKGEKPQAGTNGRSRY